MQYLKRKKTRNLYRFKNALIPLCAGPTTDAGMPIQPKILIDAESGNCQMKRRLFLMASGLVIFNVDETNQRKRAAISQVVLNTMRRQKKK